MSYLPFPLSTSGPCWRWGRQACAWGRLSRAPSAWPLTFYGVCGPSQLRRFLNVVLQHVFICFNSSRMQEKKWIKSLIRKLGTRIPTFSTNCDIPLYVVLNRSSLKFISSFNSNVFCSAWILRLLLYNHIVQLLTWMIFLNCACVSVCVCVYYLCECVCMTCDI